MTAPTSNSPISKPVLYDFSVKPRAEKRPINRNLMGTFQLTIQQESEKTEKENRALLRRIHFLSGKIEEQRQKINLLERLVISEREGKRRY